MVSREEFAARLRVVRRSAHTQRAYRSDFEHFSRWCAGRGLNPLPASEQTLIAYLLYWGDPAVQRLDGDGLLKPVTLARRIAGIRAQHKSENSSWPSASGELGDLVRDTLDYVAVVQKAVRTQPRAMSITKLAAIVDGLEDDARGTRNKALLLAGFFGAFRRSELVNMDLVDLVFSECDGPMSDEGMILHLRHSKTDQRAVGRDVYINYGPNPRFCPVRAMQRWVKVRGPETGPLFTNIWSSRRTGSSRLSPGSVNRILKAALANIGDDPCRYSAHSLRSGFATAAARAGVPARLIKQQTGHKSYEMVDRYIQSGSSLADNATRYML